MPLEKVVFISCAGHSGSTLLNLILGSHSGIFGLGELRSFRNRYPNLCGVCGSACPFWNTRPIVPLLGSYFAGGRGARRLLVAAVRRHRSIYRYLARSAGVHILVDSSKDVRWYRRQLHFTRHWRRVEPILVYLVRDGRAVVNSVLRKYPERSISSVTERWIEDKKERDRLWTDFPGARYRLRYEELALHPNIETRKLCAFIDVPFEPDMIHFWEFDHHLIGGNRVTRSQVRRGVSPGEWHNGYYDQPPAIRLDLRWKTELPSTFQEHFERVAGDFNRELRFDGHDQSGPDVRPVRPVPPD